MHQDSLTTEIMDAIAAHGAWKQRLRSAVFNKERDLPVERIKSDSMCRFGKWLETLPPETKSDPDWQDIARLHRSFHSAAGDIAGQISRGEFESALGALSAPAFNETSSKLKSALIAIASRR